MEPIPIACDLEALRPEERRRRADLASRLRSRALSVEELEDGYLFVLAPEAGGDREISDLVALESRCCAFLEFSVETGKGATRLAIRGGEGAKAFLEAEFVRGSTRGGT